MDWGTATAPIYYCNDNNINLHVWVDETRPRLQGAFLTSFELNNENIDNTIISDNTVDFLCRKQSRRLYYGADRGDENGDVINKIGTYEKALAAYENHIPFYVAIPSSSIDWSKNVEDIEIEQRSSLELVVLLG